MLKGAPHLQAVPDQEAVTVDDEQVLLCSVRRLTSRLVPDVGAIHRCVPLSGQEASCYRLQACMDGQHVDTGLHNASKFTMNTEACMHIVGHVQYHQIGKH